jgi:flagellar protein FlbD
MIRVTRLNNSELVVNAELIEFIEATPDTVITLTNDRHVVVQESVDDVIERVIEFLRAVHAAHGQAARQDVAPGRPAPPAPVG